jgi:hypothetical protein
VKRVAKKKEFIGEVAKREEVGTPSLKPTPPRIGLRGILGPEV